MHALFDTLNDRLRRHGIKLQSSYALLGMSTKLTIVIVLQARAITGDQWTL